MQENQLIKFERFDRLEDGLEEQKSPQVQRIKS